jgi:NADH dehydrogenase/NADH:ubiquinone oxidoreductase subunit G
MHTVHTVTHLKAILKEAELFSHDVVESDLDNSKEHDSTCGKERRAVLKAEGKLTKAESKLLKAKAKAKFKRLTSATAEVAKANTQATKFQADRAQTKGDGTDVVTRAVLFHIGNNGIAMFHIGNNGTAKESVATSASAVLLLPITLKENSSSSLASSVHLGARNWSRPPSASVVHPLQGQSVGYALHY